MITKQTQCTSLAHAGTAVLWSHAAKKCPLCAELQKTDLLKMQVCELKAEVAELQRLEAEIPTVELEGDEG